MASPIRSGPISTPKVMDGIRVYFDSPNIANPQLLTVQKGINDMTDLRSEKPDQDFDCSGISFPGYLRRIPCPTSPTGDTPDEPTGPILERLMIAALRRISRG
jgi:hypothetical protein